MTDTSLEDLKRHSQMLGQIGVAFDGPNDYPHREATVLEAARRVAAERDLYEAAFHLLDTHGINDAHYVISLLNKNITSSLRKTYE
jgi:hypothetical protein